MQAQQEAPQPEASQPVASSIHRTAESILSAGIQAAPDLARAEIQKGPDFYRPAIADQMLAQALSITDQVHSRWESQCLEPINRIRSLNRYIIDRSMHEAVHKLIDSLDAIVENCRQDHNDIREETALPVIIGRLAQLIEDYIPESTKAFENPGLLPHLREVESTIAAGTPFFNSLLTRMQSNDGENIIRRARMLSTLFNKA